MIIVETPLVVAHLRRAVASYVARVGVDAVPDALVALADALSAQTVSPAATTLANPQPGPQPALVSYLEAANVLGVSVSTVSRKVRRGDLAAVGRRITRTSLDHLCGRP